MGNERSGRGGIDSEQFDRLLRYKRSGTPVYEAAHKVGCDRKTAAKVFDGTHVFFQEGRLTICPVCGKRLKGGGPCRACLATPLEFEELKIDPRELLDEEGNVRELFPREDRELYQPLVESIRRNGLIQWPAVIRTADGYRVLLGGRRVQAAAEAGLPVIKCQLAACNKHRQWEALATEEWLRVERSPVERGAMFAAMLGDPDCAFSQKTIGELVGVSQSYVSRHVNLLRLPDYWRDLLSTRCISIKHAAVLLPHLANKRLLTDVWRDVDPKDPPTERQLRDLVDEALRRQESSRGAAEGAEEEGPLDELISPPSRRRGAATRDVKLKYSSEQADVVEAMLDRIAELRGFESREETVEALAREALGQTYDPEPAILSMNGQSRRAA